MNNELQTVFEKIQIILNDTNHDKVTETVLQRLVSFGYTPTEDDAFSIAFGIQKVEHHILNMTNQNTIPEGLFEVMVDMVCGEVLNGLYGSGKLNIDGLDFDSIVKSMTEGDSSITFETNTTREDRFTQLVTQLMNGKGCDLLCFRKMRW